jgi:hypothetical protein
MICDCGLSLRLVPGAFREINNPQSSIGNGHGGFSIDDFGLRIEPGL